MSRTPLFRLLQRSYRAASYSVARGEPVDELLDRRDEIRATSATTTTHPMSRRQFVAGSAAVAAVATLDACAPRTPTLTSTPQRGDGSAPVLIIGAGIAGLTAGYRLRPGRATDVVRRRRGWRGRSAAFRRRALLALCAGLHGGRLRDRRNRCASGCPSARKAGRPKKPVGAETPGRMTVR
jgi:monoamine oxidase